MGQWSEVDIVGAWGVDGVESSLYRWVDGVHTPAMEEQNRRQLATIENLRAALKEGAATNERCLLALDQAKAERNSEKRRARALGLQIELHMQEMRSMRERLAELGEEWQVQTIHQPATEGEVEEVLPASAVRRYQREELLRQKERIDRLLRGLGRGPDSELDGPKDFAPDSELDDGPDPESKS